MANNQRVNYLSNKELLAEINRCKVRYSTFIDPAFHNHDLIVNDLSEVTADLIEHAATKASKASQDVVIRLMTYDHIPLDPDRKKKSRATNQTHALVNFPPFKHFIKVDDGFKEVGRSHWRGDFETGSFTATKGRMTDRLGQSLMLIVERYGRKPNFRNYSYLDEMKAASLTQLCQVALQFDESKSSNPFAYYTTTITNVFTRILNTEKKVQNLRDDFLIAMGAAPSHTRQLEHELASLGLHEPPPIQRKRGRRTKAATAAIEAQAKPYSPEGVSAL